MNKPKEIIQLEKELNIRESVQVDFEKIISWGTNKGFFYSLNEKGAVNGIRIQEQNLKKIPNLNTFLKLEALNLSSNEISKIEGLDSLTLLTELYLDSNEISKIERLDGLMLLTSLYLDNNEISKIEGMDSLTQLTTLYLYRNQISKIEGLDSLAQLTELSLSNNQISKIEGLDSLTKLTDLNLDSNQISKIEGLDGLTKLTSLSIDYNKISKIEGLDSITKLTELSLSSNQISKIEGLDGLTKLTKLSLSSNQISKIEGLDGLTKLTELYLDRNQISKIEGLDSLTKLTWLYLSSNQISKIEALESLKDQLSYLAIHSNHLYLSEEYNDLILIDSKSKAPFDGKEQLKRVKFWFKNQNEVKSAINLPTKVLLLGNSEVGKTGLRKYLLGKEDYMDLSESTHIAEVSEWKYTPEKPELIAKIWDFGGQDYYHSLHHLFFTKASLYLLLYDTQNQKNHQPKKQDHYNFNINYWLANLNHILEIDTQKNAANKESKKTEIRKILIKNKIDKSDELVNIPPLLRVPMQFRISIVPEDQKENPDFEFYQQGLTFLKASIIHELNQLKAQDDFKVLSKYFKIIKSIKEKKFSTVILHTRKNFKKLCKTLLKKEISEDEINYLLSALHNNGLLLNFNTMPDKIWLYPEDLIVKIHDKLQKEEIITNGGGILKSTDAIELLKEDGLVDLLLEQEVIFRETKEEGNKDNSKTKIAQYYIFPQFLPLSNRSKKEKALYTLAKSNLKPAFTLRFKYFLPTSFMSRVICRFGAYPGIKHYERYELIFTEKTKINEIEENIKVWITTDLCNLEVAVHIDELSSKQNKETYLAYLFKALMIAYEGRSKHLDYATYEKGLKSKNEPSLPEKSIREFYGIEVSKAKKTGNHLPEMWKEENIFIPSDVYIQYNEYQVSYAQLNDNKDANFILAESIKEIRTQEKNNPPLMEKNQLSENKRHQYNIHKSLFRPFFKGKLKSPLKIFISYAHKNYTYLERLEVHLAGLQRLGIIDQWNDTKFKIGDVWDAKIKNKLKAADLVILLVSADFIKSAYIQKTEVEIIEQKRKKKIMPIIVEDCFWEDQTYLSDVVIYPGAILNDSGKKEIETVIPIEEYEPKAKAYKEIVKKIKEMWKDGEE